MTSSHGVTDFKSDRLGRVVTQRSTSSAADDRDDTSGSPTEVTREFESRAPGKLANAARHFELVERSAQEWFHGARPLLAPVRVAPDDPHVLEVFEPPGYLPPVALLEAGFVDGVHNLRSALDALAIELAHVDGSVPNSEAAISFPIIPKKDSAEEQGKAWGQAKRSLRTVPAPIIDRLLALQTWSSPDTTTPEFLSTLTDIDNDDKHRFGVEVHTIPVLGPNARTVPLPEQASEDTWSRPWIRLSLSPPWSGEPTLLDLEDIIPFVSVRGRIGHLFDLQRALIADTNRCIRFIASGIWPPRPEFEWGMPDGPVLVPADLPNMRRVAAQLAWVPQGRDR